MDQEEQGSPAQGCFKQLNRAPVPPLLRALQGTQGFMECRNALCPLLPGTSGAIPTSVTVAQLTNHPICKYNKRIAEKRLALTGRLVFRSNLANVGNAAGEDVTTSISSGSAFLQSLLPRQAELAKRRWREAGICTSSPCSPRGVSALNPHPGIPMCFHAFPKLCPHLLPEPWCPAPPHSLSVPRDTWCCQLCHKGTGTGGERLHSSEQESTASTLQPPLSPWAVNNVCLAITNTLLFSRN